MRFLIFSSNLCTTLNEVLNFSLTTNEELEEISEMSKEKTEMNDATVTDKAGELAKKIWLAGLGAYGKAFDEASVQYDKMSKETTKMFEDLVVKGKKLDEENHEKLSDAKTKTTSTIEDRIHKVKDSLGFMNGISMGGSQIEELSNKVDALTAKVDALLDASGAKKPATKRVRKSASAK